VKDVEAGENFTAENVRSIRPGHGLHTRHLEEILGRTASRNIQRGTPLAWELIGMQDTSSRKERERNQIRASG
jgi:pseudaminic acid synthase